MSIEKTVVVDCSVVSAIFWSITLIVSVKYVVFILRADNDGEGGIMALAALMRGVARSTARRAAFALALGVLERPCSTAARHPPVGGLFGR